MWRPFQPNPQGLLTNDCTVRAVCAVTGMDWYAAHDALCYLSRELADIPSTNRVWWTFLGGIGFRRMALPNTCPDCYTVEKFAADHPAGAYVLGPWEHAVAVIDGDWWDAWDSGQTVPTYYFEYGGNEHGLSIVPAIPDVPATADAAAKPIAGGGSVPGGQ